MRRLKQEMYFPIIVGIHLIFWCVDLYFYNGNFTEVDSDTMFFGRLQNVSWQNGHRIIGEIFSSWVVTVFAFNFLMASRAKWVEKLFGGLDKMYLIHRRSGVIAVVLLLGHFFIVPRAIDFNPGKPLGFYALVLILIGVLLSAVPFFKRKIPYHKWINFHKLMGVFYVMGVAHGFMVDSLIKQLPITRVYVFGMAIVGVLAWIYRAFLYGLFNKKLNYIVTELKNLGNGVVEIMLKPQDKKLQYNSGQFAFFTFPSVSKREQHPFTISNSAGSETLRLTIKALGDYTNDLGSKLKEGDVAKVEGPFGHFTQDYAKKTEQVWIAGGIGITPFLALANQDLTKKVDLYWCVGKEEDAVYNDELKAFAQTNRNFNYEIWDSSKKGHLDLSKLSSQNYAETDYFICGPEALKKTIYKQLKAKGVSSHNIHDEEFAFR